VLTDAEIPEDRNVIKKEAEKIIEIQCMWNVKAKVISVVTEVTGTISKSLRQYLNNIFVPDEHEIKELQKTAILCTAPYCGKC
jgi:hypothetical protein